MQAPLIDIDSFVAAVVEQLKWVPAVVYFSTDGSRKEAMVEKRRQISGMLFFPERAFRGAIVRISQIVNSNESIVVIFCVFANLCATVIGALTINHSSSWTITLIVEKNINHHAHKSCRT